MTRTPLLLSLATLAFVLAGCSAIDKLLGIEPKTALRELSVVANVDANSNSATALDLVFIYDDTARAMLPRTGPEWFATKQALLAGLATSLDVVPLQIPPATTVPALSLPRRAHSAVAVYSYANYIAAAGQPMGNLTPFKCVQLVLGPSAITYQNCS